MSLIFSYIILNMTHSLESVRFSPSNFGHKKIHIIIINHTVSDLIKKILKENKNERNILDKS